MFKHKLILGDCFFSEKEKYRKGEPVRVMFPFVATDTSYNFFADADDVHVECDGSTAVITFTMPDHDVAVSFSCRNTMMLDRTPGKMTMGPSMAHGFSEVGGSSEEPARTDDALLSEGEWECACGAKNKGRFCSECGREKPERSPSRDPTTQGKRPGPRPAYSILPNNLQ
ncbi:MAG: hypothetical protein IKR86_06855 [Candidatus Methanomethylophilaceae archaeon]|nr:hypothetical protein [Candidatus Methanomethylophilaceae archaeon]